MEKPSDSSGNVESSETNGRKILLVIGMHWEEISRSSIKFLLTRNGFQVSIVRTAAEVRCLVLKDHFDLVLLDVDLPDIDGLKLCAQFQADAATKGLPVVIWSAWGDLRNEAVKAGAVGCLEKASDFSHLSERLNQFASLRSRTT